MMNSFFRNSASPEFSNDVIKIFGENSGRKILCFAGGKGGTGKTSLTANIGVTLAAMGWKVILLDADFGGANLHTILNIPRPKHTLSHFITQKTDKLKDIVLDTPSENLRLISGGSDIVGIANLPSQTRKRIESHLDSIESDYLLIDLGAGFNYNVIDFFLLADQGFIITNPEPIAKLNAYTFLKNLVYRALEVEFRDLEDVREIIAREGKLSSEGSLPVPELIKKLGETDRIAAERIQIVLRKLDYKVVINKVRKRPGAGDASQVADLAKKYLGLEIGSAGSVREDSHVVDSSEAMMPFVLLHPGCRASMDIYNLVITLGIEDRMGRFSRENISRMRRLLRDERKYWIR
jgi:flagellar biosynthesis protein FlhG